ncbi:MAG: 2-dehydropantoate 2-reductase [Alphaproteobacteria bacterium]|nr:2-dehydropantoate 2-reductase [Alphaproteobacteria bacterium]
MGKRIVVLGAGAIGGYAGAHMTRAGEDVTLVDPWPEHVDRMNRHGMKIDGLTEPECVTIPVKAIHMTEMQRISKGRPIDIGFCSVKSYDTEWACFLLKQYLAPDGFVVSLQNCMNEEMVARTVGAEKTVGCIASTIAAELIGPGHVQRNVPLGDANHAVFRVGELHGRVTPRAQEVSELMKCGDTSMVTTNLWGERWTKLIVNSMRNGLSAATGMSGRERDSDPVTRDISLRIGAEAVRVGWALGYRLEKVAGMLPEDIVGAVDGYNAARKRVDEAMDEGNKLRNDAQRPSMGQDMAKGRRTEIELINGFVAAKGEAVGIETPANSALVEAVKRVEKGEIPASKDVVARI